MTHLELITHSAGRDHDRNLKSCQAAFIPTSLCVQSICQNTFNPIKPQDVHFWLMDKQPYSNGKRQCMPSISNASFSAWQGWAGPEGKHRGVSGPSIAQGWKDSWKRQWLCQHDFHGPCLRTQIRFQEKPCFLQNYLSQRYGDFCPRKASAHLPWTCHQPTEANSLTNSLSLLIFHHQTSPAIISKSLPCKKSL